MNRLSTDDHLDLVFHALADRTRRAMLTRLAIGPAPISELASPFAMSLPAVSKHIRVLERSHLVTRSQSGRVRTIELCDGALGHVEFWLAHYREFWESKLDALERKIARRKTLPGHAR